MGNHSDTHRRTIATIATIALSISVLFSAEVADAGTRLYTGSIQVRMHSGPGYSYSIPIGAKFSYPQMNNLPAGNIATTLGSAPAGIKIGPNQMALETSVSTSSPPTSWYASFVSSQFSGHNGPGSFSAGGAPGPATSTPVTTTASGSKFGVWFSGTPTQFGGTMQLLADFSARYGYWNTVKLPLGAVGGSLGDKRTATGYQGGTATPPTFFTESVWGFPWTTGTVIAKAPPNPYVGGSATAVSLTAMGTDQRTPQGRGRLQLVTPIVVRKRDGSSGGLLQANAGVAVVSLQFAPEPSAIAQLAVGLLGLSALYGFSRKKAGTLTDR